MKYVLTIILFLSHIIRADFINNGATLTIDEGVTVIANGSFENATGQLSNNGTLEISGNFINSDVSNFGSSSSLNLIGDNQSISGGTYNNIVVDGSGAKTMLDDVTVNGSLTLSGGTLNLNNHSLSVENIIYDGGGFSGQGNIEGAPEILSVSISSDNSTISVTFNEAVFSTTDGEGLLDINDFTFSITGGAATLPNSTPSSISSNGNTYTLGIQLSGVPNGNELLTIHPAENAVYNSSGIPANTIQSNNSISLNNESNILFIDNNSSIISV